MNNINDYHNSKKEYYDFKRPASIEVNNFGKKITIQFIQYLLEIQTQKTTKKFHIHLKI